MKKDCVYSLKNCYRDDMNIYGYRFGSGEPAACIVGAMRGNEVQQLYICSKLVKALKELEQRRAIVPHNEIMVIPSVNHNSMNIGKRFWATDNTDINRMFPGYHLGETTQRIADGVFSAIKEYHYGIHFPSFYIDGEFVPHVRMMETGFQNASLANLFGLPYIVIRKPRPYDTTTLNYNWQIWGSSAFSVYTTGTSELEEKSARMAVSSVLRFLTRMGILRYTSHSGYIASVIREDDLMSVKNGTPGIYRRLVKPGDGVRRGQVMAEILDPFEGEVIDTVESPTEGLVFFAHGAPLVMEGTVIFKVIRRLHE